TRLQIANFTSDFFDAAANPMSKTLGIDAEWNRLSVLIGVVVRVSSKDMSISAAQPDRGNAYDDFMWSGDGRRNGANFQMHDAAQDACTHRDPRISERQHLFECINRSAQTVFPIAISASMSVV